MERPPRALRAVTCHVGIYTLVGTGAPVFQVLVAHVEDGAPPVLKTFLVRGRRERGSERHHPVPAELAKSYVSLLSLELEPAERAEAAGRRSRALSELLRSTETLRVLARPFRVVDLVVDEQGVEVISARPVRGARALLTQTVSIFAVARIAVVGSYRRRGSRVESLGPVADQAGDDGRRAGDDGAPGAAGAHRARSGGGRLASAEAVRERFGTHAHKMVSEAWGAYGVSFSVRVAGEKHVFEDEGLRGKRDRDGVLESRWPVRRLFGVRDVRLADGTYRLLTPTGFVAFAFTDDQCLLLLRTAMGRLFESAYSGFSGVRPLMDYVGPEFFPRGMAEKSVYFPGFPYTYVYSVRGVRRWLEETAIGAAVSARSECGLPDVVGACGKLAVPVREPCPVLQSRADVAVFAGPAAPFRLNALKFRECPAVSLEGEDGPVCVFFPGDGGMRAPVCRVSVRGLRARILRCCVDPDDFPLLDDADLETGAARRLCGRYVARLEHGSAETYELVRGLECYVSQHITSACTASGVSWIAVEDNCKFYVMASESPGCGVSAETCVRTVLGCYWRRLFGDSEPEPACALTGRAGAAFVCSGGSLLGPLAAVCNGERVPGAHWMSVTGKAVADAIAAATAATTASPVAQEDPGRWVTTGGLRELLKSLLFRFVGMRHEPRFWVERFRPAQHPVRSHRGVIDCCPFDGVRARDGSVIVQQEGCAVHDEIGYRAYVERAFSYVRAGLYAVLRERCADEDAVARAMDDATGIGAALLDDYGTLFCVN